VIVVANSYLMMREVLNGVLPMRAFIISLVAAGVLATVGAFSLDAVQMTAAQDLSTGAVRLDHQESVNFIGREG
jgi:hypothetical protein